MKSSANVFRNPPIHREIVSKASPISFEIDSNLLKRFQCNLDKKNFTIKMGFSSISHNVSLFRNKFCQIIFFLEFEIHLLTISYLFVYTFLSLRMIQGQPLRTGFFLYLYFEDLWNGEMNKIGSYIVPTSGHLHTGYIITKRCQFHDNTLLDEFDAIQ